MPEKWWCVNIGVACSSKCPELTGFDSGFQVGEKFVGMTNIRCKVEFSIKCFIEQNCISCKVLILLLYKVSYREMDLIVMLGVCKCHSLNSPLLHFICIYCLLNISSPQYNSQASKRDDNESSMINSKCAISDIINKDEISIWEFSPIKCDLIENKLIPLDAELNILMTDMYNRPLTRKSF